MVNVRRLCKHMCARERTSAGHHEELSEVTLEKEGGAAPPPQHKRQVQPSSAGRVRHKNRVSCQAVYGMLDDEQAGLDVERSPRGRMNFSEP